jgi:DNA-binding NarL/FixJ family response regulator
MAEKISFAIFDDCSFRAHALKRLFIQYFPSLKFLFKADCKNVLLESLQSQFSQLIFVSHPFSNVAAEGVIERVKREFPSIKVIVLSNGFIHEQEVIRLIDEGANGVLPASASPSDMELAISDCVNKEYHFNELFSLSMLSILRKQKVMVKNIHPDDELTESEIELINLLYKEMTHDEIGKHKNVSTNTIDTYVSRLKQKVGAKNIVGIIKYGLKKKLIKNLD